MAAGYFTVGVAAILLGPLLEALPLVLFGSLLVAWVGVDALWIRPGIPIATIRLGAERLAEDATTGVRLAIRGLRKDDQVHVPLSASLSVSAGTNLWLARKGRAAEETHEFHVQAHVRGPQLVGPVTLRRWSPARLWVREFELGSTTLEVVPRRENIKRFRIRSRVIRPLSGRFQVNRPGQGFDFFALREYQSSDSIRDINWKASARHDEELIVNQRQRETHSEIVVMVDARLVSGVGPPGRTPLDRSCRVALAVFWEAFRNRDPVRFVAYGKELVHVPNVPPALLIQSVEELLARIPAAGDLSPRVAWESIRTQVKAAGPAIILTAAEADDQLIHVVRNMAARGHAVTIVSPTPTDSQWSKDSSRPRQEARDRVLGELRDVGAYVMDWPVGSPLVAESPRILQKVA